MKTENEFSTEITTPNGKLNVIFPREQLENTPVCAILNMKNEQEQSFIALSEEDADDLISSLEKAKTRMYSNALSIVSPDNSVTIRLKRIPDNKIVLNTNFCPSSFPAFTRALDSCNLGTIEKLENYSETNMGFYCFNLNTSEGLKDLTELLYDMIDQYILPFSPTPIKHLGSKN